MSIELPRETSSIQFVRFPPLPEYVLRAYSHITQPPTCGGEQPALLFGLSASCGKKGSIVEIGSYVGRSTIALAAAQKEKMGARIYAIDCAPHKDLRANLTRAGVEDWVILIEDFSHRVAKSWNKSIEFIFIDGNHSVMGARDDLALWTPFIVEGGFVALHDYGSFEYQGVHRAVYKLLLSKPDEWRVVSDRDTGSIIVLQRRPAGKQQHSPLYRLRCRLQLGESYKWLRARLGL